MGSKADIAGWQVAKTRVPAEPMVQPMPVVKRFRIELDFNVGLGAGESHVDIELVGLLWLDSAAERCFGIVAAAVTVQEMKRGAPPVEGVAVDQERSLSRAYRGEHRE